MTERPGGASGKVALRAFVAFAVLVAGAIALAMLDAGNRYLWLKALHVIAVISWMAGLLYLPRLFIYHIACPADSAQAATFATMERRLYRFIMTPAMLVSWAAGLTIAYEVYGFSGGWLHAKLAAVVSLTAAHIYFGKAVGAFSKGAYIGTDRYWRILNEVPTILMIAIVVLVVVKPF